MTKLTIFLKITFYILLLLLIGLIIFGIYKKFTTPTKPQTKITKAQVQPKVTLFDTDDFSPRSGTITRDSDKPVRINNPNSDTFIIVDPNSNVISTVKDHNFTVASVALHDGPNLFTIYKVTDKGLEDPRYLIYQRTDTDASPTSQILFGQVVSSLGRNIEINNLTTKQKVTLETKTNTNFKFVHPRELNDKNAPTNLTDLDKIEFNDFVFAIGEVTSNGTTKLQNTTSIISYSNVNPAPPKPNFTQGTIIKVDPKKEAITLDGDKNLYYWDEESNIGDRGPNPTGSLTVGAKVLLFTVTNKYGNMIIKTTIFN